MEGFITCSQCLRFFNPKKYIIHYWLDNEDETIGHMVFVCPYCQHEFERTDKIK